MTGTVIVSQLGARMHYAVPRILAEHGLLARFYTDICATDGWPRLVNLAPTRLLPAAVRRLVGRVPRGVPQELTTTFPTFGARSAAWRMTIRDVRQETAHAIWAGSRFSRIVARQEFRDAAGVYGFSGYALELMQVARVAGLWAAVEQMIAQLSGQQVSATQAISRAFLTNEGAWRFRPCITGEFIGKAPSLKAVFQKELPAWRAAPCESGLWQSADTGGRSAGEAILGAHAAGPRACHSR